jgi:hypothetical protein
VREVPELARFVGVDLRSTADRRARKKIAADRAPERLELRRRWRVAVAPYRRRASDAWQRPYRPRTIIGARIAPMIQRMSGNSRCQQPTGDEGRDDGAHPIASYTSLLLNLTPR